MPEVGPEQDHGHRLVLISQRGYGSPLRCGRNDREGEVIAGRSGLYWVYILASRPRGALYIGITNNLARRIREHRLGMGSSHAERYRIYRLVYWEEFTDVREAISREKQLKKWHRQWKIELVESINPAWEDWYLSLNR